MPTGKSRAKSFVYRYAKKPVYDDAHTTKRTFITILLSFGALLAFYVFLPGLPMETTGMFSSPTTYMSPLLMLSFLFLLATLTHFFRKR